MTDTLLDKITNSTCPFTGQKYDCARCNVEPEHIDMPSDTPGMNEIHMSFCITRFATGQTTKTEMKRISKGFVMDDGSHPTPDMLLEYFRELYHFGVELIPMCKCERFCFKHGCMGDRKETEDRQ